MKKEIKFAPIGEFVSEVIKRERGLVNHLRTFVGMGASMIASIKKGLFPIQSISAL